MRIILLLLAGVLGASACRRDPPQETASSATATAAQSALSSELETEVRQRGQALVGQAFGVLSSRLGRVIAESGVPGAIEFCSVHAISLTTSVGTTNQVTLRLLTQRPRNPGNRAEGQALDILRQFDSALQAGTAPEPQVVAHTPETVTFYAPIMLAMPLCLNCHGQPGSDIKPEVDAALSRIYPQDEATGFRIGQLRGAWSVEFQRAQLQSR
jgi:hypothetical protein